MESIIASSVFKLLRDKNNSPVDEVKGVDGIREMELIATCLEYTDVLHFEFLLSPPCQPLVQSVKQSIQFLTEQNIFSVSIDEKSGEKLLEINNSNSLGRLVYLKNMLRPLLDTYITGSTVLRRLVDHEAEEKRLQIAMLSEIKGQLQNKAIFYGESMALDPIRNFIQRGIDWQVLERHRKQDLRSIYTLHNDFNTGEAVDAMIARLQKLRV